MKKYIVSVDLEIEAESAEGAFEEAMKHLDYDEVLQNATVAEPYALDESACIYDHDHTKGGCEYHD